MLLDDGDGVGIAALELELVTSWMAGHLSQARTGRFVGRIPPAGSIELATIVTSDADGPVRLSLPR